MLTAWTVGSHPLRYGEREVYWEQHGTVIMWQCKQPQNHPVKCFSRFVQPNYMYHHVDMCECLYLTIFSFSIVHAQNCVSQYQL